MSNNLDSILQRLDTTDTLDECKRKVFLRILREIYIDNRAKALSISVGNGIWDYLCFVNRKDIVEITATDIVDCPVKEEDVKLLNGLGEWNFVKVKSEEALPFRDESFDLVFHQDTIEHVNKVYLFLQEQHRILKKDCFLVFGTPNLLRPANVAKMLLGRLYFPVNLGSASEIGDYIHVQEFTQWQLFNMLEEIGFRDIRIEHCCWGIHWLNLRFADSPKSKIGKTMCTYIMISARK